MSLLVEIADTILSALDFLALAYIWIIIIYTILSWVQANPHNPIVELLEHLSRPILNPISRRIWRYTYKLNLDFSPLIAILSLEILRIIIRHLRLALAGL